MNLQCFKKQPQSRYNFLTKAYGVFNVTPIFKKYDGSNRKEVAIEVPPEIHTQGRIGKP
jgi:hypothetical protein